MTTLTELLAALGVSVLGVGAPIAVAVVSGAEADWWGPLIANGPLGVIAAYLLYRQREERRDEREERGKAWTAVGELRGAVQEQTQELVKIVTILERSRPPQ